MPSGAFYSHNTNSHTLGHMWWTPGMQDALDSVGCFCYIKPNIHTKDEEFDEQTRYFDIILFGNSVAFVLAWLFSVNKKADRAAGVQKMKKGLRIWISVLSSFSFCCDWAQDISVKLRSPLAKKLIYQCLVQHSFQVRFKEKCFVFCCLFCFLSLLSIWSNWMGHWLAFGLYS